MYHSYAYSIHFLFVVHTLVSYTDGLSLTRKSTVSSMKLVESLSELEKKTYFCLRIPEDCVERSIEEEEDRFLLGKGTSACTVECQRIDKNPLGWDLPGSDGDDETCVRRAFAFTTIPRKTIPYKGPCVFHCRQLPFSYGKLGGTVWYAAIALGQYIALNPSLVEGKSVLELGAGIGIPGIVASKCGAKSVCLSEFGYEGEVSGPIVEPEGKESQRLLPSALLSNLRYNVELNSCDPEVVAVKHLDWFDFVNDSSTAPPQSIEISDKEFDLIIGSDLVNWEEDVRPLLSTLKYFLANGKTKALLFISIENRKALPTFIDLINHDFAVVETRKIYIMQYDEMKPILLVSLTQSK